MINAGIRIAPFNGQQQWDPGTESWKGVGVTVNYPNDQDPVNNPVSVGDYLIEETGKVWSVKGAVKGEDGTTNYTLELKLESEEPSSAIMPGLGTVVRGGIITPINNFMAPYWDTSVVSAEVGRVTAYRNMKYISGLWYGDVPGVRLEEEPL